MLRPQMFRPVAAVMLAIGLFLTLSGCSDNKPPSDKGDKKSDSTSNTNPTPNPNSTPKPNATPEPSTIPPPLPPAELVNLNVGVGKEAMAFSTALKDGTVRASQLSMRFAKAIGLPAELPGDKAKGYSLDAAEGWLKRVGSRRDLSAPLISKQVGDVAMFRGMFIVPPGGYCLRMIHEEGAWKVDWLSLSSVEIQGASPNSSNADIVCQEFTVAAVIGTLTDKDVLPKEDRAVVLAAGLTPALKARWAEALPSDKAEGYDYNRGLMMQKAAEFSAGAESFTYTQQGNTPVFRVEVTRSGGAKTAYLVKLVKGTGPGQWLVDDVTLQ